ncbi:hypothetical protein [Mycobacterium phage Weirdo19]|uniref:Uncharacterized protein n=1 Tax=Mycobacterium phage Weirdo19 TaxID=2601610 RepID=A0A6M2YSV7_9CAUD|nr:hypothetical protein KDJ11_gp49 [Mycobacterium phage Weirdo19]QEA10817.1 hypothetical protein [Mycobacterium phage Weirdo19]
MSAAAPAWVGYTVRQCPVCKAAVETHREPVADERREVVVYHWHRDGIGKVCRMRRAALAAVAFTGITTAEAVAS